MGQEISVGSNQELEGMKKYAGFSPGQVEMIRYFILNFRKLLIQFSKSLEKNLI